MTLLGVYWPMVFWEGTFGYLWLHFLHLQLHVIFKVSLPQTNISTSQLKIPSLIGHQMGTSLRSRRKRGRGRGARTRAKNGGLGARDEGTPATKTPIFSFLRLPAAAKF